VNQDSRMRITLPSGTPAEIQHVDGSTRGLVVFPDIFGLRPLFDDHVARFASEWGMTTIAIEPFPVSAVGRDLGADLDGRFAAVSTLNDVDKFRDLNEAADATGCDSVAMIGFCMGGMYCFKAAAAKRFSRIASFYGMIRLPETWHGDGQGEPLALLRAEPAEAAKVLAIIGNRDTWTPDPDVADLRTTGVNVVEYSDAEHGFAHDSTRPAHRVDDAADAFRRAKEWLSA
jgi:dienelactone hydrolase